MWANSPVEFAHDYLYPSPEARDTVSFGLDDILLIYCGPNSRPERRKLPFFSDLHQEISRSWKQPFSSRLTNAAAADFTNLVCSVEQGYTAIPVAEDTLASHLSPSLAPSWKSRPLLPTMPCRTTSALIGKSYIAADQAGMALHMMAILQAYQADVLKEMDEGTGLTPEAVKELRRATDLALRATKHTARVGPSMVGSVAAERHLWLDFTEIREKEKVFLLDAPISQSGLFGEAVSSVVEKFRSAKTQSDDLKQFMPRSNPYPERSLLAGAAPKLCILPRPRSGEPVAGLFLANDRADGLTWSSPADLPLRLLRVVPDPRVGMRRASSSLRGETRPQNHICPPQTRSPHSDLSYPPLEVWCAEKVQHQFSLVWQLGDALGLPPLPSVLLPPADCMIRDTIGSLLQRTSFSPVLHSSSSQTRGFPSWWRASLLPGLLDTPSQVCPPQHDTLLPLSHFIHEWEHLPGVSLWVLCTVQSGYTLQFGRNPPPPRFNGVQLTVVNSASKASVLQQELSSLL